MTIKKGSLNHAGRPKLYSPGQPTAGRPVRQHFWLGIYSGLSTVEAALSAKVSCPVGVRWFREAGGMPPSHLKQSAPLLSGRYLSFAERERIALERAKGHGIRQIARMLFRSASTISRELRRNAATRSGGLEYRATTAQWHAERAARRPKCAKLVANPRLRVYVQERLSGKILSVNGRAVQGPQVVAWKGRRHGPRQHRRWARAWSPAQIASRLRRDFPNDSSMRISHEAIYQALYVQGRGALRRELTACLRTGRTLRVPRARSGRGKSFVTPDILISQRPATVLDRAVPGHWEGDLILGLGKSAIGTLVERTTRYTVLLHLPPMPEHGLRPREKHGPALAGHGAAAVRDAITRTMARFPQQLRQSLTWDQGAEMAQHLQLRIDAGLQVYFCDPHSPWQRGTNENTNGLLRQYFPKGTDLTRYSPNDLEAVALALNTRPRKTLGWLTPAEALNDVLQTKHRRRRPSAAFASD